MKIKVKDIQFNPFRNTDLVPIDPVTIEKLKSSIDDLGLWAGMTARPHPTIKGKYQIPFGHHRLVAIKELNIQEIDIAIIEISDFNMVLMMVQENMTQRGVSVEMINGTVREVKEFLDGELAKYESWEELPDCLMVSLDSKRDQDKATQFGNLKTKGVGQTTILKFLKGSIPQWRIASALNLINSNDIDTEAVNLLDTTGRVDGFKRAIRKVNIDRKKKGQEPIAKEEQKELAKIIKDTPANGKTGGGNYYKSMENIIRQTIDDTDEFETKLNEVKFELDGINTDTKRLSNKIGIFNGKLNEMGVTNYGYGVDLLINDSAVNNILAQRTKKVTKAIQLSINLFDDLQVCFPEAKKVLKISGNIMTETLFGILGRIDNSRLPVAQRKALKGIIAKGLPESDEE